MRNKQNLQATPAPTKSVGQKTIFRQEVEDNLRKKNPVMRIRKKQRKPSESLTVEPSANGAQEEARTSEVSPQTVQMVSEMIKEAGPVLSPKEIEIISDVSQEVGAKINKEQIKVISMLSEAMGPSLNKEEVRTKLLLCLLWRQNIIDRVTRQAKFSRTLESGCFG